ncbi:tyrosine-protein kinase, neurotrophic receptor, type 2 [Artemisia annua]|uniref:Tyrosine-protein kinase, neurotrophic receptor, type 2 n=1 Tax=Artemisia annua TaxID=35608 RepID=A0A2U1PXS0_ARTAN|nr:tyrosine-protein kinase, neurotrophic receptor, type 2 [Artemisia annua]
MNMHSSEDTQHHVLLPATGSNARGTIFYGSATVVAAIKRLDPSSNQGAPEFWAEVEMLSKLRHCNLVSLFGYCNDGKEMILVYEYMPNGTLEDHLHKLGTQLSWVQRLKICVGAGRGLHYLHTAIWAQESIKEGNLKNIIDPDLRGQISSKSLKEFVRITKRCLHSSPKQRSTMADVLFSLESSILNLQEKLNNSVLPAGRTILDRMINMLPFPSNGENTAQGDSKPSSEGKSRIGTNTVGADNIPTLDTSELPADYEARSLKEFEYDDLKKATKNFGRDMLLGEGGFGKVYLGWVDQNTFAPSKPGVGVPVAVKSLNKDSAQGHAEWQATQGDSKPSSEGKSRIGTNTVGADNIPTLDTSELPADYEARSLKEFEYDDLKKATKNFGRDMLLGEGGFGKVYLGWVDQNTFAPSKPGVGVPVAVKSLNKDSAQGHAEWQAKKPRKEEESLRQELDRPNAPNTAEPLSWGTRLIIMIGVARGLTYLHSTQNQVMCREVKASNILLDKDFTAKLADFGLAKSSPKIGESHVSTRVVGTYGYVDPAYIATGHLCVKSDIYSFGVVLLEILTGLRVLDTSRPTERQNLVHWLCPILGRKRKLKTLMDPRLEQNYPLEGAFKCAALALRCLENQPKDRPSSEEVLRSLEEIYAAKK